MSIQTKTLSHVPEVPLTFKQHLDALYPAISDNDKAVIMNKGVSLVLDSTKVGKWMTIGMIAGVIIALSAGVGISSSPGADCGWLIPASIFTGMFIGLAVGYKIDCRAKKQLEKQYRDENTQIDQETFTYLKNRVSEQLYMRSFSLLPQSSRYGSHGFTDKVFAETMRANTATRTQYYRIVNNLTLQALIS